MHDFQEGFLGQNEKPILRNEPNLKWIAIGAKALRFGI